MHFSRILIAVVVTCATGALAAQLTVPAASNTMRNFTGRADFYEGNISGAGGRDAGNVSKASQVD